MKTLAQVDAIFGDPYQAPMGQEGKPREHLNHVMLFYELSLIDMLVRDSKHNKENAAEAVLSRIYSGGWLFRMEPREFFQNYLENWYIRNLQDCARS